MNRSLFLVLFFVFAPAQMMGMECSLVPSKSDRNLSSIVSKLPFFPLEKTDELPSMGHVIQTFGFARSDIMCGLALLPRELRFEIVNKLLDDEKSVNYFLRMPFLGAITKFCGQIKKQEAGNLFLKTINPGKLFRLSVEKQNFVMEQDKKSHILEQCTGVIMMTPQELTDVLVEEEELGESFLPENTPVLVVANLTCYNKCMILNPLIFAMSGSVAAEVLMATICPVSECSTTLIGTVGIGVPLGFLIAGGVWSVSNYIQMVRKKSHPMNF